MVPGEGWYLEEMDRRERFKGTNTYVPAVVRVFHPLPSITRR